VTESRSATTAGERETAAAGTPNRWLILVAAVLVQLAIGAVYAWLGRQGARFVWRGTLAAGRLAGRLSRSVARRLPGR